MIVKTGNLDITSILDDDEKKHIYNCFDSAITADVHSYLLGTIEENPYKSYFLKTYETLISHSKIILKMNSNVMMINPKYESLKASWKVEIEKYSNAFNELYIKLAGTPKLKVMKTKTVTETYLTGSSLDKTNLVKNVLKIKTKGKISFGEKERLKWVEEYPPLEPIMYIIEKAEAFKKLKSALFKTDFSPKTNMLGELPNMLKVGTVNDRWKGNPNPMGIGGNKQNITSKLKELFEAPEGYTVFDVDAEQIEARILALLIKTETGNSNYLEAINSGDMHTYFCRLCFPDLNWVWDINEDRKIAENTIFAKDKSYRDILKTIIYSTSYLGTPQGVAKRIGIEVKDAKVMQDLFYDISNLKAYMELLKKELQETGVLISLAGRARVFYSDLYAQKSMREAINFNPQQTVAFFFTERIIKTCEEFPFIVPINQVHDSFVGLIPDEFTYKLRAIAESMNITVEHKGEKIMIPSSISYGKNWGKKTETNLRGIVDVK